MLHVVEQSALRSTDSGVRTQEWNSTPRRLGPTWSLGLGYGLTLPVPNLTQFPNLTALWFKFAAGAVTPVTVVCLGILKLSSPIASILNQIAVKLSQIGHGDRGPRGTEAWMFHQYRPVYQLCLVTGVM